MSNFKIKKEHIYLPKIIQVDSIYTANIELLTNDGFKNKYNKIGVLYNSCGKLIYRGTDGTITIIANN
jgi:hypothetical protein